MIQNVSWSCRQVQTATVHIFLYSEVTAIGVSPAAILGFDDTTVVVVVIAAAMVLLAIVWAISCYNYTNMFQVLSHSTSF